MIRVLAYLAAVFVLGWSALLVGEFLSLIFLYYGPDWTLR